MHTRFALDLSHLGTHGHDHRSVTWWGTLGFIAIEGTVFVLAAASYVYLMTLEAGWPPREPPPDLFWGSLFTVVLLLSMIPNVWLKRASDSENERKS